MRTYGRTRDPITGAKTWRVVATTPDGANDLVWLTTLAQACKLNLGESPFFGNYGIAAHNAVVTQIAPDFYVNRTQRQFAKYFASLILQRMPDTGDDRGGPTPYYQVSVVTHAGVQLPPITVPY